MKQNILIQPILNIESISSWKLLAKKKLRFFSKSLTEILTIFKEAPCLPNYGKHKTTSIIFLKMFCLKTLWSFFLKVCICLSLSFVIFMLIVYVFVFVRDVHESVCVSLQTHVYISHAIYFVFLLAFSLPVCFVIVFN